MKHVKRYLSIFMVIAMIIVMAAACGGKGIRWIGNGSNRGRYKVRTGSRA